MSDLNDSLLPTQEETGKHQLMDLINELQDAVTEMKQAFLVALDQLKAGSEEDVLLRRSVESNKVEAQEQTAQVLRLVLSFKSEFAWVRSALEAAQEQSATLTRAVRRMEGDRDALLDELVSCGAISQLTRDRLQNPSGSIHYHCDVRPEHSSSSGAPSSSDSGVAHLLERAHAAFSIAPHPSPLYQNADSVRREKGTASPPIDNKLWPVEGGTGDTNLNQVSTMVREYVAGLVSGKGNCVGGTENQWMEETRREEALSSPDSDSSLSRAITKSLGLSTSLGRQCGLELDQTNGVPPPPLEHQANSKNAAMGKNRKSSLRSMHASSDSDTESSRLISSLPKYPHCGGNEAPSGLQAGLTDMNRKDGQSNGRINGDEVLRSDGISEEVQLEERRHVLIMELIENEHSYCATLHTLKQAFAEPLSAQDILSPKDVDTLFPREVEALHQQHTSLLTMLEESICRMGQSEQLGQILRNFIEPEGLDALHLYTSYVDNFPDALQTFHKLCRCSPEFTNFLKDCLKSPDCGGLDLGGFLLTPVQRLPRLVLVLRRLMALTPQHHPDWAPLSYTITRLATFLSRLNDSMEHSFQLVAAQIGAPPESEGGDYGALDTFDDVCGESTTNEDCLETMNDLTSEGETGMDGSASHMSQTTKSKETLDTCDTGSRRRMNQKVSYSEWEKPRTLSATSGTQDTSMHSSVNASISTSIHANPEVEKIPDETKQTRKLYHVEDTPSKTVGCQCVRRCREPRAMKKYSKLCSIKSRDGSSSPELMRSEAHGRTPPRYATEWGMVGREQGKSAERSKRPSRCDRMEDQCRTVNSPSCCDRDCSSGHVVVERRRGMSLPRRGCSGDVRRRTHSTGRTARERDTSSDEDSTAPKMCFHAHECKVSSSPSKGKGKRRWFKTSKSMHDFQNQVGEVYGDGVNDERNRRRQCSGDDCKLSVARSADDLSVNGSISSKDVGRDVEVQGEPEEGRRQFTYSARMLRCSSLEVAMMGKLNENIQSDKGSSSATAKEESEKKGKSKRLSLRASIKNMLSFKRRYVKDVSSREVVTNSKESAPKPAAIAFGCPYKVDENLQSLINQLNRMPTYIQLVIFCLKETSV